MPDSDLYGVWVGLGCGLARGFLLAEPQRWVYSGAKETNPWKLTERSIQSRREGLKLRSAAQAARFVRNLVHAYWSRVDPIPLCSLKWPLSSSCWVDFYPSAAILPTLLHLNSSLWALENRIPFSVLSTSPAEGAYSASVSHTPKQPGLFLPKQPGLFLLFLWLKFPGESRFLQEVLIVMQWKKHFKDTQKLSGDRTSPQQARQLCLVYNFQNVLSRAPRVWL